jgi:hypothetical protein
MSLSTNLQEFRNNIESALAAIPQIEISTNPNTYRLIKLLSWTRIAEKDIGGGSGGSGGGTGTDTAGENLGAPESSPATSNSGTFSISSLIKRFLSYFLSEKIYFGTTISTNGANIVIDAPGSTSELCITAIRVQSESPVSTNVLIEKGASDANPIRIRTTGDGTGLSETFGPSNFIACGANNALIIELDGANAHQVSIGYFLRSTTTGIPTDSGNNSGAN